MKISVIVPVYNVAPYLQACLDSIANAIKNCKETEIEVLCINDGSTDGSDEILENNVDQNWGTLASYKIVNQCNLGVATARNVALAASLGDWVLFLDADDIINSNTFSMFERAIASSPDVQMISFSLKRFVKHEDFISSHNGFPIVEVDVSKEIRRKDFDSYFTQYFYKREIIGNTRFQSYVVGEDLLFKMECLVKVKRICELPFPLYGYRIRDNSASHGKWSVRKLTDELCYRADWIACVAKNNRKVAASCYRATGLFITEFFVSIILSVPAIERAGIWDVWFEKMQMFSMEKNFPLWSRLVMMICGASRSKTLSYILCAIPHKLKSIGFHR